MVNILRAYMKIRGGKQTDYLFCDEYGRMLTENALRLAITHYNHSRGVEKNVDSSVPSYLCPEILGGLRRKCVHAPKAVGTRDAENDKALLQHL